MNNKEFAKAFVQAYQKVATTAEYSMVIAGKIGFGNGINAADMPKEMAAKVEEFKGGCCFHHAWRLIYELDKVGISAYWACVPEPSEERPRDQKCVVVYEAPDGNRYVADIVEDIKAGVKMEDFVIGTCKWINKHGEIVDNSCIELIKMVKISDGPLAKGYLDIYPKPDSDISFDEYLKTGNCETIE